MCKFSKLTFASIILGLVVATVGVKSASAEDPPVVCGDGTAAGDEMCDDGNKVDGDSCSADCSWVTATINMSWDAVCGNDVVEDGEACDNGRHCDSGPQKGAFCTRDSECPGDDAVCVTQDGDGCSADCATPDPVAMAKHAQNRDHMQGWFIRRFAADMLRLQAQFNNLRRARNLGSKAATVVSITK